SQEEGSGRARKVLAEVKVETGKLDEAISIVEDILSENRKDLAGKFLKARIALAEKRFNDAKVLFGEVIRKDAELAPARLFNGMNEVMLGNIE
ncbi:MAG: tetratricopeptide repeat protein, partial [Deltaproteobacteria bacterium]|nr:tetratricopeptide repeat protein [Deltaproteobacteria bacterium]